MIKDIEITNFRCFDRLKVSGCKRINLSIPMPRILGKEAENFLKKRPFDKNGLFDNLDS